MAESWFSLSRADQAEALEVAAAQTGRPPHLLEKDIWVVWTPLCNLQVKSFKETNLQRGYITLEGLPNH